MMDGVVVFFVAKWFYEVAYGDMKMRNNDYSSAYTVCDMNRLLELLKHHNSSFSCILAAFFIDVATENLMLRVC